jgi:hypothetical protein
VQYVIINHRSGHILAVLQADDPMRACVDLDQRTATAPRHYEVVHALANNEPGYRVYHADDLPPITDGTHPHQIELVECECRLVATVRVGEG